MQVINIVVKCQNFHFNFHIAKVNTVRTKYLLTLKHTVC